MKEEIKNGKSSTLVHLLLKFLYGILIGVSAVLPGISGGVLCVIFGIYPVMMDLISHPFTNLKNKLKILLPYMVGMAVGFWSVAKMLELVFVRFEAPATCVFIGLIAGMLPSLFVSVGSGKGKAFSYLALILSCVTVLGILASLRVLNIVIKPNIFWYVLCGAALAISVIVPGMSFSTMLMPLGLYTPFVQGIGEFDFLVLIPAGVGAVFTVIAFARLVSNLFAKHYSVAQNIVIGVVIAATLIIIPFESFGASIGSAIVNSICILVGVAAALLFSKFNKKHEEKKNTPQ